MYNEYIDVNWKSFLLLLCTIRIYINTLLTGSFMQKLTRATGNFSTIEDWNA